MLLYGIGTGGGSMWVHPRHGGHSPTQQLRLLQSVCQLLLLQFMFDVQTEWHHAFLLLAVLGVVATQCNELLAYGALPVGLSFAYFGVLHHSFHLLAARQTTVGIATLASVDQTLDAALDGQAASLLWVTRRPAVGLHVKLKSPLLHLVFVTNLPVAVTAQVIVLLMKSEKEI